MHLLKSRGCVAQAKGHAPVCKCSEGTGEGGFLLIFGGDRDLMESRVSIKATVVCAACQTLKHLVDEGKRKVVLSG